MQAVDARLPWAEFWFGPDLYAGDFDLIRIIALGVGGLGVLALLLAAAGLYAVIAYVVSLRQREFGIRMAIGARPADLRRLVGRSALRLSAWGLASAWSSPFRWRSSSAPSSSACRCSCWIRWCGRR